MALFPKDHQILVVWPAATTRALEAMIKTLEATYDDGVLRLAEPLDLAPRSRVRVRIEIPVSSAEDAELSAKLDEAYADAPDEDEKLLQKHMARLRRKHAETW